MKELYNKIAELYQKMGHFESQKKMQKFKKVALITKLSPDLLKHKEKIKQLELKIKDYELICGKQKLAYVNDKKVNLIDKIKDYMQRDAELKEKIAEQSKKITSFTMTFLART